MIVADETSVNKKYELTKTHETISAPSEVIPFHCPNYSAHMEVVLYGRQGIVGFFIVSAFTIIIKNNKNNWMEES